LNVNTHPSVKVIKILDEIAEKKLFFVFDSTPMRLAVLIGLLGLLLLLHQVDNGSDAMEILVRICNTGLCSRLDLLTSM